MGSGVQACAALCWARAASRRACRASASGWRAQAASKACRSPGGAASAFVAGVQSLAGPARPMCRQRRRLPRWRAAARPSFEFFGASDAPVLRTTHGRSASGDQEVASCPTAPHAAARTQARTGFREGRDPPRRSGEGQPLRAFGSGRCVRTRRSSSTVALGGAVARRAGNRCRQGQHHAAEAMAVTAVQIHGAGCLVAVGVGSTSASAASPAWVSASAWCWWSW